MATGNAIQGATGPASPPSGAAGGALAGSYPNPSLNNSAIPGWTAADQGFIAQNYDGPAATSGGSQVLATAGTLYVQAVKLTAAALITNIITELVTNGGTLTAGQCFAALYQGAGGALIGQTADQAAAWGAGAAKQLTMPLAGGPFAVAAGVVYVAWWFNGTTGPAFFRTSGIQSLMNAGLAAAASRWGTADTGKTTTAPPTLGVISPASTSYWVALG
jgi:hypothetical protein